MSMNDLDLFSNDDIPKDWEEGEDGRKGSFAIDDEKGYMVDFETIGQVMDARSTFVGVRNNNDFVSSINELLRIVSSAS